MSRSLRILTAAAAAGLVSTVATATPAAASESEYLRLLQPKYTSFTSQQLLNEAQRVCDATSRGMTSPDIVNMVMKDLSASVAASVDIVSTAIIQFSC